jgi:hypothetical protein
VCNIILYLYHVLFLDPCYNYELQELQFHFCDCLETRKILYMALLVIKNYVNTMRTARQICDFPFKNMGTGCQRSDF